ncbi:hypothetical protein N7505_000585 [Penicillium chrysogenum]|uniref:Uncharacterized protein n=1 Tax=Penicillium chrysogenum TaxID=5076 RepID=A0ABQ8WVE2_PENCH|nr:hypothetical protein N7524_010470 [Penicillium chrysogenum]KAJ5282605.1 hypothetical protein N7505_000585 [Penicillium chrysogenum]
MGDRNRVLSRRPIWTPNSHWCVLRRVVRPCAYAQMERIAIGKIHNPRLPLDEGNAAWLSPVKSTVVYQTPLDWPMIYRTGNDVGLRMFTSVSRRCGLAFDMTMPRCKP